MEFSWFFLWLGVALLGLGLLLLRTWWRERRFPGAALTLSAGLLLIASSVQQLFIFGMGVSGRWEVDSTPFVALSILAAVLATAVWGVIATRRGRESLRRSASRPRRIQELETPRRHRALELASRPGRAGRRRHPRDCRSGGRGRRRGPPPLRRRSPHARRCGGEWDPRPAVAGVRARRLGRLQPVLPRPRAAARRERRWRRASLEDGARAFHRRPKRSRRSDPLRGKRRRHA